ncbi:MAG: MBL fold metallo-hydrolase, partial [Methanosarcinales archaeon]|nr:MBL fold metallo-hydrolase [Methanosarcinales archaeon]
MMRSSAPAPPPSGPHERLAPPGASAPGGRAAGMDKGWGQLGDLAVWRVQPPGGFRRMEYILECILITRCIDYLLGDLPDPLRIACLFELWPEGSGLGGCRRRTTAVWCHLALIGNRPKAFKIVPSARNSGARSRISFRDGMETYRKRSKQHRKGNRTIMKIEILGTESLGVRGLSCLVEADGRTIVIDPGVALGYLRRGKLPHPCQVAVGAEVREKIVRALGRATDVVISHYHGDHIPLADANPYQLSLSRVPPLDGVRLWCKGPGGLS